MNQDVQPSGGPATADKAGLILPLASLVVALIAAGLLVAAGFGYRFGLWNFRSGFTILRYGGYCGLAGALAGAAAFAISFRQRRTRALVLSFCAFAIGLTTVAVPLSWMLSARRLPRIHDITTDVINPPRFNAVILLRRDAPNPVDYGGAEIAALQQKAYPEVKTLILNQPQQKAFAACLETASGMGWKIVESSPGEGRIEATDTTFWFGFTDDIVVRVTSAGERSLVDVRSVSRVGISDVGTNAARIRAFLEKLEGKN